MSAFTNFIKSLSTYFFVSFEPPKSFENLSNRVVDWVKYFQIHWISKRRKQIFKANFKISKKIPIFHGCELVGVKTGHIKEVVLFIPYLVKHALLHIVVTPYFKIRAWMYGSMLTLTVTFTRRNLLMTRNLIIIDTDSAWKTILHERSVQC